MRQNTKKLVGAVVFLGLAAALMAMVFTAQAREFTSDELDDLLAPIALYPDPLLAQVLVAATHPDQIHEAWSDLQQGMDPQAIDSQDWDVSVKAVAHYQSVLNMMSERMDWTVALGQAYVNQADEVSDTIQNFRVDARNEGNLQSNNEEQVVVNDGYIEIWPAQSDYVYVPQYDPYRAYNDYDYGITYSSPFFIGPWLVFDFDWRNHRVFNHHWNSNSGWVGRSRGHINNSSAFASARVNASSSVNNRSSNWESGNRNVAHSNAQVSASASQASIASATANHHNWSGRSSGSSNNSTASRSEGHHRTVNTATPQPQQQQARVSKPAAIQSAVTPQTTASQRQWSHGNSNFSHSNGSGNGNATHWQGHQSGGPVPHAQTSFSAHNEPRPAAPTVMPHPGQNGGAPNGSGHGGHGGHEEHK